MFTSICNFIIKLLFIALLSLSIANAKELNDFVLDDALIPPGQIFSGGPDKDGIPSIDHPEFVTVADAGFIENNDSVLGIVIDGVAKAYPISILNWHEIVNDSIGDTFYAITYCPLCGTGMAFNSRISGQTLSFGVSGLLYNNDVLLYDRETKSLWSQLMSQAVTGKYKGEKLKMLAVVHTRWVDWKRLHPLTLVLSEKTGYARNYSRNPYGAYARSRQLYFPVTHGAPLKFHPKEKILGVELDSTYKAYPFIELNKRGIEKIVDTINGKKYTVHWNKQAQSGYISDEHGSVVPTVQSYWFAWYAFHPETSVFSAADK